MFTTPITGALRYGAYHRVSDANGRDLSDETTITDKEAWSKIDGWAGSTGVVIAERYLDWDVSGSKLKRPALDRMLDDLREGRIDGIVVAKTDRLSRAKTGDALRLVGEIQEIRPGCLALLDLGVDPTTPTGEMMLTMLLGFARMQWRQFKESWGAAQTRAMARGVWMSPVPYGYVRTDASTLAPDPATAEIVTGAFKVAATDGMHAAMAYLAGKAPERRWRTDEVRRLLKCRAYLGESYHGKLSNKRAHKALTTPSYFAAAQTEPRSRRTDGDYVLSHVATCSACGGGMIGTLQTSRGKQYRRMRCSECRGCAISADKLEAYVREVVEAGLGDRTFRARFDVDGLSEAEETVAVLQADLDDWSMDLDLRRDIGAEAVKAGARARAQAVAEAREAFRAISKQAAVTDRLPAAGEVEDDDEQLLRAIRGMVASIVVLPGTGARNVATTDRVVLSWLKVDDLARPLAA